MEVVTVYTNKGGVGKTTLSWLIGEGLTYCNKNADVKVLLIDMDQQRNLTSTLIDSASREKVCKESNVLKVLLGDSISANTVSTGFKNLFLVPGSIEVSNQENFQVDRLYNAIAEFKMSEYATVIDYIIIDNHGKADVWTDAALLAAEKILVPFECDHYNIDALQHIMRIIREKYPDKLNQIKIIPNKFKPVNTMWSFLDAARISYQDKITRTTIPLGQDIAKIMMENKSLYIKKSGTGKVAEALKELIAELFGYDVNDINKKLILERKERMSERARQAFQKMESKIAEVPNE
jgi:chromosome partitioning protein